VVSADGERWKPTVRWGEVDSECEILIADEDQDTRELVSAVLWQAGFSTCEATSGQEALAAARRGRPRLVLLEVELPGITGYEVCRSLRDEYGEGLPIIFVSAERTDPLDRTAGLLIGGDDYVVKPFDPVELVARVRRFVTRSRPDQSRYSGAAAFSALTEREREVLGQLAKGRPQTAIAEELCISPKTVATHIQRILMKLGVHSRAEAVALAHHKPPHARA